MTPYQIDKLVNFVKMNYLQNSFKPDRETICPYFQGHNTKSFVSFYNEQILLLDSKNGNTIDENKLIGVMTSRPIHISIHNPTSTFDAYYVDYLCVDASYRKKGIAPQLIQTHHYTQSHTNPDICVSLFKREGELTGIVPLCVYKTYGFSVDRWTKPPDLSPVYKLLEINPQNIHILADFIKLTGQAKFDIVLTTEISNMIELIKSKNIFVHVILHNDNVWAAYFFRRTRVFVKKNAESLLCFASINNCDNTGLFVNGFKISFWKIANDNKIGFSTIENISDNNIIIDNLVLKTPPVNVSPTAYFFYNFAYPSFHPQKVLLLN
jgi:GNAT superfamily N-acetyltransferase